MRRAALDECIRLARSDITIRTSVLEARLVCGDAALANTLAERFDREIARGTALEFVTAKLAERDERYKQTETSRYVVEPNVKEGKGGLRDLHTLFWIAQYVYHVREVEELVGSRPVHPRRAQPVPEGRGFPLGRALPPALRGGPRRGPAELRIPAGHRLPARLPVASAASSASSAS